MTVIHVFHVVVVRAGARANYNIAAPNEERAKLAALRLDNQKYKGYAKADVPEYQYCEITHVCTIDQIVRNTKRGA